MDYQCPFCRGSFDPKTRTCTGCGFRIHEINGIPVFLNAETLEHVRSEEKSDAENAFKNFFKRWPRLYRLLLHLCVPVLFSGITARQFLRGLSPQPERVLNIGSGPTLVHPKATNVDIFPFPNVHLLAEAAALPFPDNTFDAVCSEQVLEHVREPWNVARELVRVTKPGGVIYTSTPWMFPLHPSPKDYSRWSVDGLADLFQGCEKERAGVLLGPVSGTLIVLANGLATIFSFGITPIRKVLNYALMAVLTPFKLLDFVYAFLPGSEETAASYWVVVKKC